MNVAIIGGGAAGFFAAISVKENYPDAKVTIFEKSAKFLAKVKVSGGGRCNVTNACNTVNELSTAYPRGKNSLKKAFKVFNNRDAMHWFETKGVALVTQEDNCVFPESQDSQTIIDCFIQYARSHNVDLSLKSGVKSITSENNKLAVSFIDQDIPGQVFDKIIVTTGGSPKRKGLEWLAQLGHKIEEPVPSLFTFNLPSNPVTKLMGIVVENASVSIQGTRLKSTGPLLVTHWGMSGPAILVLSAFGARILYEKNYQFKFQVNWVNIKQHQKVFEQLDSIAIKHTNKHLSNFRPYSLPERLWLYLLGKAQLSQDKKWGELGKKGINKLVEILTNDIYSADGKTTFKEEFVTCGGVSLDSIDFNTLQSKVVPNLYFAGEVLDIDGITGGYNFQAAWTTAYIAAQLK